jgi:molecular chaperone GrpE
VLDEQPKKTNETGALGEGGAEKPEAPMPESETEKAVQGLQNEILYLRAEIENLKKRSHKNREEGIHWGQEMLWKEVFPVYVNLTRALKALDSHSSSSEQVVQGIRMVLKEFEGVFQHRGLKIVWAEDSVFDPELHEALDTEERHDLRESRILLEYEPGFKLHNRVVKPAKVRVGVPSQTKDKEKEGDEGNSGGSENAD